MNKQELSQLLTRLSKSGFRTESFVSVLSNAPFIEIWKGAKMYHAGNIEQTKMWFSYYQSNGFPTLQSEYGQFQQRLNRVASTTFVDECSDCGCELVNEHPENRCGDCHNKFEEWYAEQCGFNQPENYDESPHYSNAAWCYYAAIILLILAILIFESRLPMIFAGLPGIIFFFGGLHNTMKHFIWVKKQNSLK